MDEAGFERLTQLRQALSKSQPHLFESASKKLDEQLLRLESATSGGLVDYCRRAVPLLKQSCEVSKTENAKRKFTEPPLGEKLKVNTPRFEECEELGCSKLVSCIFYISFGFRLF